MGVGSPHQEQALLLRQLRERRAHPAGDDVPRERRWRDRGRQRHPRPREATGADHFIDIDAPEGFAALPDDRFRYAEWLRAQGKEAKDVGFLPYAMLEGYQRMQVLMRLWRESKDVGEKAQIAENVVYYAGVLGHYVGDGANPLHTTIHYNGWSTSSNPDYATREPLHWRFESEFVKARIVEDDVLPLVKPGERLRDPFADVMRYLLQSHALVRELYRMEGVARWDGADTNPDAKRFVAGRLSAGAQMLVNLWYTAWVESGKGTGAAAAGP